jgi:hypothetical protein
MSGSPWAGVVDAARTAARRFGDPVAMEGVNALDTAGDAIEQIGQAFCDVGQTIAETVKWDPRVQPYFEQLGTYIKAAAKPTRDGAAAVRRAHDPQIKRIEENDRRERRWDIGEHDR